MVLLGELLPPFFMKRSENLRRKVLAMVELGLAYAEIREMEGVSITTIRRWRFPEYHQKAIEAHLAWKEANPEKMAAAQKNWRKNHPEKARVKDKRHYHRKYARYPHKFHQRSAKYRNAKRKLTFPMTEIERMMCDNYYEMARELTKTTGVKHHVDHIWPISKGGPHLPWNLRVITAQENWSKGNKI